MKPRHLLAGALAALLVFLAGYSVYLAQNRIYQVDECQNIYMARVLATGQGAEFFTYHSLFLMGPLSWITKSATQSTTAFTTARYLYLGIFWFNVLLLAWIASGKLFSLRGLVALAGAATLAPLWDYGFEIRHDNLLLTSLLLIWWSVRTKPMGLLSYAIVGALTVVSLLVAVKAIVYVVPLALAVLVVPPPAFKKPRGQLALAMFAGALCATAFIRISSGSWDAWNTYLFVLRHVGGFSAAGSTELGASRFWPWDTFQRVLVHTPLLPALVAGGVFAALRELSKRRIAGLTWDSALPEIVLLGIALGAIMINPTPYPYNLVNLLPFAFIVAFKYGDSIWIALREQRSWLPFAGAILILAHFTPFAIATARHLEYPNHRQTELMQLAEKLTDPAKDRVYDAIGMVPTRRSIHHQWYLHSLSIRSMTRGDGPRVRDMLTERPASVLITSYRTNWLPPEDQTYIKQHYVPLSGDFWVLGNTLPAGGGTFEIVHPGRYRIVSLRQSHPPSLNPRGTNEIVISNQAPRALNLDGSALTGPTVELTAGMHRLESPGDFEPTIVWIGPQLSEIPQLKTANHRRLFVNWY